MKPSESTDLVRCETLARRQTPAGWLSIETRTLRLHRGDGSQTQDFAAEAAHRKGIDAVAVAAWRRTGPGPLDVEVLLRGCLRPGVLIRAELDPPVAGHTWPLLWELPAGIPEADERGAEGLRHCAARELLEETGVALPDAALLPLGNGFFPSGGILAEMLWLYAAEVPADASPPVEPEGDGSPFEAVGHARWWPLVEAQAHLRAGATLEGASFFDAKTEIGLGRLAALLTEG